MRYQKNIWLILVERCEHAPQEGAIIFQSSLRRLIKFEGDFVPSCKHFFLLQTQLPFLLMILSYSWSFTDDFIFPSKYSV